MRFFGPGVEGSQCIEFVGTWDSNYVEVPGYDEGPANRRANLFQRDIGKQRGERQLFALRVRREHAEIADDRGWATPAAGTARARAVTIKESGAGTKIQRAARNCAALPST